MKNSVGLIVLLLCLVTLGESKEIRRFALAVGSNFGGDERVPLRYATTDASSFLSVLNQMGGVSKSDTILLKEPTKAQFETMLQVMRKRIERVSSAQIKTEVILYYSGHANDKGLLLGEELFGYRELRGAINSIGSDVKITILDACASGSITRFKGGLRRKAFLVDESTDMKGYAFITSSSGDEVSQESDKISGSFFTHYLVSGLRGAADISGDGKVTLSEAYQFAFNETLSNTEKTQGGAQHANYDMKLTGTGDVVFTDVRQISSGLLLGETVRGRVFVRNQDGHLIVELNKQAGRSIELGLEPNEYVVSLEQKDDYKTTTLTIPKGKRLVLNDRDFRSEKREKTVSRGDTITLASQGPLKHIIIDDSENPRARPNFPNERETDTEIFYNEKHEPFNGTMISLGVNNSHVGLSEMQIAGIGNINSGYIGGIQAAGVFNLAEDINYFQGAGFINVARNIRGFQSAGSVNFAKNVEGFQASGYINIAERVSGFQGTGFVNYADSLSGFQVAGFVNIAGPVQGLQGAGFVNVSDNIEGFQGAGFVNVSDNVEGFQGAGFVNVSDTVTGSQASGFVNIADNVTGGQFTSMLNVADDVHGAQVGIINIADSCDYPIGLLNFSAKGRFNGAFWVDETGMDNVSLITGGKKTFSIFTFGRKLLSKSKPMMAGLGFGYIQEFQRMYVQFDINGYAIWAEDRPESYAQANSLYRAKVATGIKFGSYGALYGGVSYNTLMVEEGKTPYVQPWGGASVNSQFADHDIYKWPGYFIGLRVGI